MEFGGRTGQELGLSVTDGAEALGVRAGTLSNLLIGKAALSRETALPVEETFGIRMDTLLRLQAWHVVQVKR